MLIITNITFMTTQNNTQKRVYKNKGIYLLEEKEIMPFFRAFGNLKGDDQAAVKEVICKLCKWSSTYFSYKKTGARGLTYKEQRVVKSAFQCFNIDAFTGETIQNL